MSELGAFLGAPVKLWPLQPADKLDHYRVYQVLQGSGAFLLEGRELPMGPGLMLIAPEGVPHGIRNDGDERLVVLAILAPGPS